MKRREALIALGSGGLGAIAGAVAVTQRGLQATKATQVTPEMAAMLLRRMGGFEPEPGEAEVVAGLMNTMQRVPDSDPRIQPALGFNPEV